MEEAPPVEALEGRHAWKDSRSCLRFKTGKTPALQGVFCPGVKWEKSPCI